MDDFVAYCDEQGRFADFHSNRHTFITSLERSWVSPRTAQSLARHSDIRLTMGVYTHIELHDQRAAIESLPAPPVWTGDAPPEAAVLPTTGPWAFPRCEQWCQEVPKMVPFASHRTSTKLHRIARKTGETAYRAKKNPSP